VLSERVKLKDYIGRINFLIPRHIFPTGSVTPVSVVVMSGKKTPW